MHAWMMKQKPPAWLYPCQEEGSSSPLSLHSSQAWLRMWSSVILPIAPAAAGLQPPVCVCASGPGVCSSHCNMTSNSTFSAHSRSSILIEYTTHIHTYIKGRTSWSRSVRYLPRRMGDMAVMLLRIPTRFPYPLNIFELNFFFSVLLEDARLYVRRQNDRLYSSKNF